MPGCEGLVNDDDLGMFRPTPKAPSESNKELRRANAAELAKSVELFNVLLQPLLRDGEDTKDVLTTWGRRRGM
jgi:hypothetical protein